jgi:hypothetical protein
MEHIKHLILNTKPLNQSLRILKFLLRNTIGENNRTKYRFEEMIENGL